MNALCRYLRISVTDRCNLRCIYCYPPQEPADTHSLPAEQVIHFARLAAMCGVRKLRITGGEPLLHERVVEIVRGVTDNGLMQVGLTTNGLFLEALAAPLRAAGLSCVNISLPSLRPDIFARMTQGGDVKDVLRGIEAVLRQRYSPIKLNVVVMRGLNDREIPDLARLARNDPVEVRFIEFMPFQRLDRDFLVPNAEVLEQLRRLGEIRPCEDGNGPSAARSYEVRGFRGRIGLISPLTRPFCQGCDRLRLTADGKLHACLVEGGQMDVAPLLRNGLDVERLRSLLAQCMAMKPARHHGSFRGVMTYMGG